MNKKHLKEAITYLAFVLISFIPAGLMLGLSLGSGANWVFSWVMRSPIDYLDEIGVAIGLTYGVLTTVLALSTPRFSQLLFIKLKLHPPSLEPIERRLKQLQSSNPFFKHLINTLETVGIIFIMMPCLVITGIGALFGGVVGSLLVAIFEGVAKILRLRKF